MMRRVGEFLLLGAALVGFIVPAGARDNRRAIDVQHSTLTIHVYKSGLFSAFGHNHEVAAPLEEGRVSLAAPLGVELRVAACKLRVLDPEVSADERAKVQKTMEGPEVLDCARFPEIRFQSTSVEKSGTSQWTVRGMLTLHGQTQPVSVAVGEEHGRYRGSANLKQRQFGITPVSIAGGTVKVKDEIKVEFDIRLVE